MSSGQTARTPAAFPRMKVRGHRRRRRAAQRRYGSVYVSIIPDFLPMRSALREAMREIGEAARVAAEKTAVPKLWVTW